MDNGLRILRGRLEALKASRRVKGGVRKVWFVGIREEVSMGSQVVVSLDGFHVGHKKI